MKGVLFKLALLDLLLVPVIGIPAFIVGESYGAKEAPRVITDRQACERWADKCIARGGLPGVGFGTRPVGQLTAEPACRLQDPNDRIEVE
jgi:hypothetical protein